MNQEKYFNTEPSPHGYKKCFHFIVINTKINIIRESRNYHDNFGSLNYNLVCLLISKKKKIILYKSMSLLSK